MQFQNQRPFKVFLKNVSVKNNAIFYLWEVSISLPFNGTLGKIKNKQVKPFEE